MSMNFQAHIESKVLKYNIFSCLKHSDVVFILHINVKMPTIVGILTFLNRINFMLSLVEHEQSFIASGTAWTVQVIIWNIHFKIELRTHG